MQVGDLVKLSYEAETGVRPEDHWGRIGIITEWHGVDGWVQWAGNTDWDMEYIEDL